MRNYRSPELTEDAVSLVTKVEGQTTDNVATTISSVPLGANDNKLIGVKGVATAFDGGNRAGYIFNGFFYRVMGGNVTQQGSTASLFQEESNADWDLNFVRNTSENRVDIKATGSVGTVVNWSIEVSVLAI